MLNTESGFIWVLELIHEIPEVIRKREGRPPVVVVLMSPATSFYKKIVEEVAPDIILMPDEIGQITAAVENLQHQLLVRKQKRVQERSVTQRNKELQTLAHDLEKIVEERTLWIEASNREQKELIRNERSFVQFLIEISLRHSKEEVLKIFRDQLRRLQLAQEAFLLEDRQIKLIGNSALQDIDISEEALDSAEPQSFSEESSRRLAKTLSRPVGRLIAFPLPRFENGPLTSLVIEKVGAKVMGTFESAVIKKYTQALGISLERLRLEETNRISALRWEKVFDGSEDPVAIVTDSFDVVRSNQAFEIQPGAGKCYQVWAQRQTPCLNCTLANSAPSAEIQKGDRLFQVVKSVLPAQALTDSRIFLHRYVDVTEKRQEHIRFIQNEKLSSIGQIAEHLAHEIYNPLAGIIALVQILLMDPQHPESVRRDLEEIQKAAVRAQKVIENLQDFVRQESEVVRTQLDEIVDKTLPLLKMKWRSYRVSLDLRASEGSILVQPQLISQVIYNLIQNACQAMKPGQNLQIRTALVQGDLGPVAQLIVEDEGAGIPAHLQDSIFKPFFTTKPMGEGTGLGLSLSKQIVERFNGRLYFQSEPGVGTRFFLEIPIEKSH